MAATILGDPKTAIQKRKSGIWFYADKLKTLHIVFSNLITKTLGNTNCICNVYLSLILHNLFKVTMQFIEG